MSGQDLAAANRVVADFYVDLGRRIAAARRGRGIVQADVATEVGLTRASLANIEAGRQRPNLHVFIAIAQALGVELSDLVGGEVPQMAEQLPPRLNEVVGRVRATVEATVAALEQELAELRTLLDSGTGGVR